MRVVLQRSFSENQRRKSFETRIQERNLAWYNGILTDAPFRYCSQAVCVLLVLSAFLQGTNRCWCRRGPCHDLWETFGLFFGFWQTDVTENWTLRQRCILKLCSKFHFSFNKNWWCFWCVSSHQSMFTKKTSCLFNTKFPYLQILWSSWERSQTYPFKKRAPLFQFGGSHGDFLRPLEVGETQLDPVSQGDSMEVPHATERCGAVWFLFYVQKLVDIFFDV